MTKFKVGDRVRITECTNHLYIGTEGQVFQVDPGGGYEIRVRVYNGDLRWSNGVHLETTKPLASEVHFILQYELDKDPFETFATMKEVEARIQELAKRADLKRESIKVYEIAKTYDVTLETRVIFGGVKMEEKKRGRPALSTD